MKSRARMFVAFTRGIARVQKSFTLEIGPLKATGIPAVLLGVTGIVLAGGVTAALSRSASRLPETLDAARQLATAINNTSPRLRA
jgi:hypothetical protein